MTNDINQMVPAELAIRNAMLEVEKMPADERLTAAAVLLENAKCRVAEYVDSMAVSAPRERQTRSTTSI